MQFQTPWGFLKDGSSLEVNPTALEAAKIEKESGFLQTVRKFSLWSLNGRKFISSQEHSNLAAGVFFRTIVDFSSRGDLAWPQNAERNSLWWKAKQRFNVASSQSDFRSYPASRWTCQDTDRWNLLWHKSGQIFIAAPNNSNTKMSFWHRQQQKEQQKWICIRFYF